MLNLFQSRSMKVLLLGYIALLLLFFALIFMDSNLLKNQLGIIDTSEISVKKMGTIVNLIEVARKRTRLSHAMLAAEDVFVKDEINQKISNLASEFIHYNQLFLQLEPDSFESKILNQQRPLYTGVIEKIDEVKALAFEETPEADTQARSIIILSIVPMQERIIDGFMKILNRLQQNMYESREGAFSEYINNSQYRNMLIASIFLASFLVLLWVMQRMFTIESRLKSISLTDALTGIANRRNFDEKIIAECKRSKRENDTLSLLLVDIDYFKNFNDHYGHQKGDECLVNVAQTINKHARRANDLAARVGGEEFALIFPGIDEHNALKLADAMVEEISQKRIPHEKSQITDHLTISVGVASIKPANDESWEQLISKADQALYLSKEKGRNQAILYAATN